MRRDEFRRCLISGTVSVIAREGLDGASAKQIETETGINVAYIYRCFKDKDDLFAKTFSSLNQELVDVIFEALPIIFVPEMSFTEKFRLFFKPIWRFMLENREKCLCYIRYYYSPYFKKYSFEEHVNIYRPIVEKISVIFKDEANVWMLLGHAMNVLLDFAVEVFNGSVPDNEDTEEHVFRLIYYSVSPYFKRSSEIFNQLISSAVNSVQ